MLAALVRSVRLAPQLAFILIFLVSTALPITPASAADKVVKLLESGDEPRQVLRYQPAEGLVEQSELELKISMNMQIGDMPIPMDLPTLIMRMQTTVTKVHEGGDISYDYVVRGVDVGESDLPDPALAPVREQARGIVGTQAKVRMTRAGHITSSEITPSPSASPEMVANIERSMRNTGSPLPSQAVGVGARWEYREKVVDNGLPTQRITTFSLTDLSEDRATLKVQIAQTAKPQPIEDPTLPEGTRATLDKLDGSGGGSLVIDLGRVLPHSSDLGVTVTTLATITPPSGNPQSMTMEMKLGTTVRSVDE